MHTTEPLPQRSSGSGTGVLCLSVEDLIPVQIVLAEQTIRAGWNPNLMRGAEPTGGVPKINLAFTHNLEVAVEQFLGSHRYSLLSVRLSNPSRNVPLTLHKLQVPNINRGVGMSSTDSKRWFYQGFFNTGRLIRSCLTEASDGELAEIIRESEGLLKAALFEQTGREEDRKNGRSQ